MWKFILCQLRINNWCQPDESVEQKLFEKTQIILFQAVTLKHVQMASVLIRQDEKVMNEQQYPLFMVERHHELIKLWNKRFKRWKRG